MEGHVGVTAYLACALVLVEPRRYRSFAPCTGQDPLQHHCTEVPRAFFIASS